MKDFVKASRSNGISAGFYFSGPDWYKTRAHRSFNHRSEGGGNSSLPPIPGRPEVNGHASAAVCTPTCYSMLTGQYSWRREVNGVNRSVTNGASPLTIPIDMVTAPGLLRKVAYHTGIVGKWHAPARPCLVNLADDPGETANLADQNPAEIRRLVDRVSRVKFTPVTRPQAPALAAVTL